MRKILVIPTWVLIPILRPTFSKNHPWKNKRFTLEDWANNSTDLNKHISFVFWMNGFCLIISFLILTLKH